MRDERGLLGAGPAEIEYGARQLNHGCLVHEARPWVLERTLKNHGRPDGRHVTPDHRHFGQEEAILANRQRVYEEARRRNPERWSGSLRDWTPVGEVRLNPERLLAKKIEMGEAA